MGARGAPCHIVCVELHQNTKTKANTNTKPGIKDLNYHQDGWPMAIWKEGVFPQAEEKMHFVDQCNATNVHTSIHNSYN